MKSSYRIMRVLVLFDLPSVEKEEKRVYTKFRKELLKDGFTMMQYSIYMRFCRNVQDANKHIEKVRKEAPKDGHIRILSITEHQFDEMIIVIGEQTETEKTIKDDYLVVIE